MGGDNSGQKQEAAASAQQQANSQQLFNLTEPGLAQAENYGQLLASGDPTKIFSAVAPGVNSIIGNTEQAKQNILNNGPRGGTQDLALEQADVSKAAQIGNLQSSAYTSSFPMLANLAQTGLGISTSQAQNAIQGYGQVAQSQSADKASTMGFLGSVAGGAGEAAGGIWCWIAAVVFDEDFVSGPRVNLVREWLRDYYSQTFVGRYVVAAYARYGERAAKVIARSRILKRVFLALFRVALNKAQEKYLYV